jgi:hypothetical protein
MMVCKFLPFTRVEAGGRLHQTQCRLRRDPTIAQRLERHARQVTFSPRFKGGVVLLRKLHRLRAIDAI